MKDVFVFLAMVAAVAGMMVGGFMASGDEPHGWAGVLGGLAILAVTYVVSRSRPNASTQPAKAADEPGDDAETVATTTEA